MTYEEYMSTVNSVINQMSPYPMRKCDCGDPMCNLEYFDNGFYKVKLPENVVSVDFVNKKRRK